MNNRIVYILSLFVLIQLGCKDKYVEDHCLTQESSGKPNILLIIADDLGLESSPCYDIGPESLHMPVLESLCDRGIVYDNVWSNPFCAPTRASMITGKHGVRTGVLNISTDNTLNESEQTIQALIDEEMPDVYCQAIIGKWHLSNEINDANYPFRMGIPYFDGMLRGTPRDYYDWRRTVNGNTQASKGYMTSVLTDSAINWINDREASPWFLWLAYSAPHKPFHAPPVDLHTKGYLPEDKASIDANPLLYYHAMLEALDKEIGRLLDNVPQNVLDNTIIIFLSDNGTPKDVIQSPYTENQAKGTLHQGGVHVPMIVAGKGVERMGERDPSLINTTDIFATVANLTGMPIEEIHDSKSFVGTFQSPNATSRTFNYTDMISGWAYRDERYKFVYKSNTDSRRLFDLQEDPYESDNLINSPEPNIQAIISELESKAVLLREQ